MLLETFPPRAEFRDWLAASSVVPVGARILADTETPVSVLARFAPHHPHLFLLESAFKIHIEFVDVREKIQVAVVSEIFSREFIVTGDTTIGQVRFQSKVIAEFVAESDRSRHSC